MSRKANHKHSYVPVLSRHISYGIQYEGESNREIWRLVGKCTICGHHREINEYTKQFSWLDSLCADGYIKLQQMQTLYPIDETYDFLNKKECD